MTRVLVVDDDFMVARIHQGFVEKFPGFTVVGAVHTGTAALDAIERLRPDLVLLDIYLPDLSGLEVLRRLRHEGSDVDVIAITAAQDTETVRMALRGGVVHYIVKPFTFDTLRERLERYTAAVAQLGETAAQADIDRLFGAASGTATAPVSAGPSGAGVPPALPAFSGGRTGLPKGLAGRTADLIISVLRAADTDLSAAECAARAGLSRVSTRRYLEHLVHLGRAEVRLRYGGAGRPEHRYRWRG